MKRFVNFEQADVDAPWRFSIRDWWQVIKRTFISGQIDNVTVIAAGVAFFSLLAVFPLISAAISIFSLFTDPGDVDRIAASVASLMPAEAYKIIELQIINVLDTGGQKLGVGIIIPLTIALFAAGSGIRAMMRAMNVAYEERETRNIFVFYLYAILMTLGSVVFIWMSLLVIVGVPSALASVKLDEAADWSTRTLPWILLVFVFSFSCGVMYRFGPSRRPARKRWIWPGIALATLSWLGISFAFSRFVAQFGSYNETFGGLASVVILLVWLWLTATAIIFGAELNSELERQTIADTTRGPDRPLGNRGAVMADYVARKTDPILIKTEAEDAKPVDL